MCYIGRLHFQYPIILHSPIVLYIWQLAGSRPWTGNMRLRWTVAWAYDSGSGRGWWCPSGPGIMVHGYWVHGTCGCDCGDGVVRMGAMKPRGLGTCGCVYVCRGTYPCCIPHVIRRVSMPFVWCKRVIRDWLIAITSIRRLPNWCVRNSCAHDSSFIHVIVPTACSLASVLPTQLKTRCSQRGTESAPPLSHWISMYTCPLYLLLPATSFTNPFMGQYCQPISSYL